MIVKLLKYIIIILLDKTKKTTMSLLVISWNFNFQLFVLEPHTAFCFSALKHKNILVISKLSGFYTFDLRNIKKYIFALFLANSLIICLLREYFLFHLNELNNYHQSLQFSVKIFIRCVYIVKYFLFIKQVDVIAQLSIYVKVYYGCDYRAKIWIIVHIKDPWALLFK